MVKEKKSEVSLVLVNKNYQDLAKELFPSLEKQRFQDFELIVVDYGSKNPDAIINMAENSDISPIKSYKIDDVNVQEARNFGVSKTQGEYICVLELDAVYRPGFLKIMLEELKSASEDVAYVYCNFEYMRHRVKQLQEVPEFQEDNIKGWQTPVLTKREYMVDYTPQVQKLMDWDWALKVYKEKGGKGKKISTSEPLFIHLQPYGRTISWKKRSDHQKWKKFLVDKYPGLIK